MFGPVTNPANEHLPDLNMREYATLIPLVILAFWIGIYPKPLFTVLDQPVRQIMAQVNPDYYKTAGIAAPQTPRQDRRAASRATRGGAHREPLEREKLLGATQRSLAASIWRGLCWGSECPGRRESLTRAMNTAPFAHDFFMILPEVELALFGLAILLLDYLLGVKEKAFNAVVAMFGVIQRLFALPAARAGAGRHRRF